MAGGKGPEEHRLRLLRRVLRALTGFLVRGFPDAPGHSRSGRRDHGRFDEPGRSAPSAGRLRCSVLQDRWHRGRSRSLLRYDLVSRDRLVCSLEAWTGGVGGVRGVTGPRGARALLRGGWAPSGRSTSAASFTGTGPVDPSHTPGATRPRSRCVTATPGQTCENPVL